MTENSVIATAICGATIVALALMLLARSCYDRETQVDLARIEKGAACAACPEYRCTLERK